MTPRTEHLVWQGPAGDLEVSIDRPTELTAGLAVIAHPHPLFGGTRDNKVVQTLARAFLQLGYLTLRFNFRGVQGSHGEHDHGLGEAHDMVHLITKAHNELLPDELQHKTIALGGFSFGAFVCASAAQILQENPVHGLQPGKMALVGTATSRFKVPQVPSDTLVIHGETDDTVPLSTVLDWARPQNLPVLVIPGGEHFFHGRLPQLKELVVRYYPTQIS